jgi:cysteine desulfurase
MLAAMNCLGNPSSVHFEGRMAKYLLENARDSLGVSLGCRPSSIVFTSGATEAASIALNAFKIKCSGVEHDAIKSLCEQTLTTYASGEILVEDPSTCAVQLANSETGILQELPKDIFLSDVTQAVGKIPFSFEWLGAKRVIVSAHKFGGPKGVGALIIEEGTPLSPLIIGGGQEKGRRSGTENIIGAVGMAAAASSALVDLEQGVWNEVEKLRNVLEISIEESLNKTIFIGRGTKRLPNTSLIVNPGWSGETQVIQLDLAGYAVSAGSACSSGKVKASAVLQSMGLDSEQASCGLRVSLGPETTIEDINGFVKAYCNAGKKVMSRWKA